MPCRAAYVQDLPHLRSHYAKAGLKKRIKSNLSRAQRSAAKRDVARETTLALMDHPANAGTYSLRVAPTGSGRLASVSAFFLGIAYLALASSILTLSEVSDVHVVSVP